MLQTLSIKNFALISDEIIEFKPGFNVLVGQTGAGKSLILDALSFSLGAKSSKLNIRNGESKLFVQAVFDDVGDEINVLLDEFGIEYEDNLIISRSLHADGKSEARVNGVIVSTSFLKRLSELLVDTYVQNENITLLNPKNHLAILDKYDSERIEQKKDVISKLSNQLGDINQKMKMLGGDETERARRLDLLDFQIKDIEGIAPKVGEDDELKSEIERLSNFEKISESVKSAASFAYSVNESLSECERALGVAERYSNDVSEILERIKSSKIEIGDIFETLEELSDQNYDQSEIERLLKRFDDIKSLKKKYGADVQSVLEYLESIKEEYDNLLFGEQKLAELEVEKNGVKKELYKECVSLSDIRKGVALKIEKDVLSELALLGFKNCKFKIAFGDLGNIDDVSFSKDGIDQVEFLFSANVGEELKSLSKTVSGGEASRFMLALKNVFANCFNASTYIFDEVDTGISGEIGQMVARRLAMLSKGAQLICITHLCQVTAMADNYIYVEKIVDNKKTYTKIRYLSDDESIEYIALVSGAEPTSVATMFAKELKQKADEFKLSLD